MDVLEFKDSKGKNVESDCECLGDRLDTKLNNSLLGDSVDTGDEVEGRKYSVGDVNVLRSVMFVDKVGMVDIRVIDINERRGKGLAAGLEKNVPNQIEVDPAKLEGVDMWIIGDVKGSVENLPCHEFEGT